MPGADHQPTTWWRSSVILRAFDPEVGDAIWRALEQLVPVPVDAHPLGCHRPRIPDRVRFQGMLIRLVTGCAWVDIEALLGGQVSDTTLRARRDEWIAAGVFDALAEEALAAYDRIIVLDLSPGQPGRLPAQSPLWGRGNGPEPHGFEAGSGRKRSIIAGADGIPFGWTLDGANRQDMRLLEPTLAAAAQQGLLSDIDTLHLDRGYDNGVSPPALRHARASRSSSAPASDLEARRS